ncbi:glutathione ABC transporter substrate-binding protein [soil metagenome]
MSRKSQPHAGQLFDQRMTNYLGALRHHSVSRRGFVRLGAGAVGIGAASMAGAKPFLPGVSVLAQDATSFTFALEGDVRGLEPALAYDFAANPVVCQISEGLMQFLPDGSMQPLLAESFEQPDALTYLYKIRTGILFHNGEEMTLDDVIASIDRVQDETVAGPMGWMYDPVESIEKLDDVTLQITLSAPSALFRYVAATTAGHVVPASAIEEFGLDLAINPVGTGPYRFVRYDQGSEIELEKNTDYWQEGKPYFDSVSFKIVPEGTTRIAGMSNDEINSMTQVPPDQIETVQAMENITWHEVVGYTINMSTFRTDQPPFDDVNVRKAFAMAIPYEDIMANIVKSTGVQSFNSTVPPEMPGSAGDQIPAPVFDLEGARALLAESALPDGFSTKYNVIAPNDVWIPMAIAIQQAVAELNIDLEIVQMAYDQMITLQQAGDYEGLMNFQWGSDFPDASGMLLPLFHSRNIPPQNNHAYYSNPDVDAMLDQQEEEQDADARNQLLVDIQTAIVEDQPACFFEHFKWFMPMSSNLTGYEVTPLWYWDAFCRDLQVIAE